MDLLVNPDQRLNPARTGSPKGLEMAHDTGKQCVFCSGSEEKFVRRNDLAYAIWDGFPVTSLHALIIPNRHVPDLFDLSEEETLACYQLLAEMRREIHAVDSLVQGFNIGVNIGLVAGQTILHCHIHLIPRRARDVDNPQGGVRHIFPGKGNYLECAESNSTPGAASD